MPTFNQSPASQATRSISVQPIAVQAGQEVAQWKEFFERFQLLPGGSIVNLSVPVVAIQVGPEVAFFREVFEKYSIFSGGQIVALTIGSSGTSLPTTGQIWPSGFR